MGNSQVEHGQGASDALRKELARVEEWGAGSGAEDRRSSPGQDLWQGRPGLHLGTRRRTVDGHRLEARFTLHHAEQLAPDGADADDGHQGRLGGAGPQSPAQPFQGQAVHAAPGSAVVRPGAGGAQQATGDRTQVVEGPGAGPRRAGLFQ